MKVNVCLVCTGGYSRFLPSFLESSEKHLLLSDSEVRYHIFSDDPVARDEKVVNHFWPHAPWPFPTLRRYQAMLSAWHILAECDHILYLDVDMRFVSPVGCEVLGDLVAVRHHGYHYKTIDESPFERRLESTCCTLSPETYYAGALQGGSPDRWGAAMRQMQEWIDTDWRNGIIPRENDESVWNRYLSTTPPTVELPATYCWHQPHPVHRPYAMYDPIDPPKIVALYKDAR